ncbi:MAG: PilW family protein [Deltaproteobacteria bacterium]|nr:PilW family protein [Deltaproteobacteria bacterium]
MKEGRRKTGDRFRGSAEAGFTLIEVLMALAIMTIAMTAVFATFLSQQQSFTVQSRVAEMQQNLRIAVDSMTRDIRMAGYGMPLTTNTVNDNVALPGTMNPAGITTMRSLYAVDNTAGPDQLYILYLYDMDDNQPPGTLSVMAADLTSVNVVIDNSLANGFLPGGGELVLVADGVTADLFQTTSVTAGTTPTLNFAGGPAYNGGSPLHTKLYVAGASPGFPPTVVGKARFVRYFIENNTLMVDRMIGGGVTPQPLADDIEDLQLSYGLDTDSDGFVDASRNDMGDAVMTAGEIRQVRQVRLHLVARSRLPEKDWSGIRPAIGNHPGAATNDGYRRRTIEVNIDVRNSGT